MEHILTRTCSKCKEEKEITEFSKHKYNKSGYRPDCKSCNKKYYLKNIEEKKEYGKKYREKNRDSYLEYFKKYNAENKHKRREQNLRKQYGITQKDYDEMLKKQGGVCKICGTENPKGHSGKLYVDHNHKTGDVRGLLCSRCNSILGYCDDREEVLLKAVEYLRGSLC